VQITLYPSKLPHHKGDMDRWFLGPIRVHCQNGISICSAIFAGLKIVTDLSIDIQTMACYFICNNRLQLHGSEMRPNDKLCTIVATDGSGQ